MTLTIANDQTLSLLAHLRIKADLELLPKHPYFHEKPYPLGRCREIRDAVFERLKNSILDESNPNTQPLRAYLVEGHKIEKIWGALRGQYFQNAMKVGDFYVDCANDTVNPNKPRVEILPMSESGFKPITDFEEFASVAEKYWEVSVYRNTVCPAIAPFFPLIFVDKNNKSWITSNDHMIKIAQDSKFEKSEIALETFPVIDQAHQASWRRRLNDFTSEPLLRGEQNPEVFCQQYRKDNLHSDNKFRDAVVTAFTKISGPV